MRKIAISDIHGCRRSLLALLDKIAFSQPDELYLLGDYVDRGPDSKGVLDDIFHWQRSGYTVHCLRGNHEELMLQAASDGLADLERWLRNGGGEAMDSFGVSEPSGIRAEYLRWMEALPYFLETDGYILVHGGLDFSQPDPLAATGAMCWIRYWYPYMEYDWLNGRIIVHGHTPIGKQDIENQFANLETNGYLDIDAGCVYAGSILPSRAGLGYLCAYDMGNRTLTFQENVD